MLSHGLVSAALSCFSAPQELLTGYPETPQKLASGLVSAALSCFSSPQELLTGYPETPQRPPETKKFEYFNFLNYALDQPGISKP